MRDLTVVASATVVGLLLVGASPTLAKKSPACPGGRFPVSGPLVPGGSAADAIVIIGTQVSIESGCAAVAARRKLMKAGTQLAAKWNGCGSLTGLVRLVVTIDGATCGALTGRFTNRTHRIKRKISARIEMPAGAFGGPRDPLPPGAVLVTPEEWNQMRLRPDFHGVDPSQVNADAAAEARRDAQDGQTVMDFVAENPSLAAQYLGGVDPNDQSVAPADGGNHALTFTDSTGAANTVITHGERWFRPDRGGHAVLVTGLVDNPQLPAGAPAGSGGGYLIIKNSWSNCYGDAGYAYLPYDWVKAYGLAAEVVGDIN